MMKIKALRLTTAAAVVGSLCVAATANSAEFNANIFFPDKHPLAKHGYVEWAEAIDSASGGRLKANVYAGTVLLPPRSGMSGVRDGIAQVGYHAGTYTPAELPISNALQELGFNYEDPLVMMVAATDFNMTNEDALAQWKKAGVIYGGGYSTPPYNLMCSMPVKSMADLKGKRLRTAGAALSRWAESVGAVPVNVPSSEMYQGVEKGTLDCAVNVASDLKSRSLWDVAKHTTMASLGMYWSGPMWAYNVDFWKEMNDEDRRMFFDSHATALAKLYVGYAAAIDVALEEAKSHGVTVYEPDDEVRASISEFAQSNMANVHDTARDKHGIEDPEGLFAKFDESVTKWKNLFTNVDRTNADAIAVIIKSELYDKLDVATYGVN